MANFDFYSTGPIRKLDNDLGISVWNISVWKAPQETGNLRKSIHLQQNGPKVKRIWYDDYNANYIEFLENGTSRNRRHVGFIENDTVTAILQETYLYLLTGQTTYATTPVITERLGKVRNYERRLLSDIGYNLNRRITANDRARLSRLQYRKTVGPNQNNQYTRNMHSVIAIGGQPDRTRMVFGKLKGV